MKANSILILSDDKETNMQIYPKYNYKLSLLGEYPMATELYLKARSTKGVIIQGREAVNSKERVFVSPCIYRNGKWVSDQAFIRFNFDRSNCDKWKLYWIAYKKNGAQNIRNVSNFIVPVKRYKPFKY